MKFYNITDCSEQVTFSQALIRGLGKNRGLFFPVDLPKFSISDLLDMNFVDRSVCILSEYIGSDFNNEIIFNCVKNAFNFPVPLIFLNDNVAVLELFHGPTLAFKDFGSRLMAYMLSHVRKKYNDKPMVIITATSGDTGAAVAHAFYGLHNIYVIILYPRDKVTVLQEKLFCTLGSNIFTFSVSGDFDICQYLVKQVFEDRELCTLLNLNSANSINISRLLAQVCYYFEAVSQLPVKFRKKLVFSVPSGNFGNLTAGLLAQFCGLPIKKFIAATNVNNTVPRYLKSGLWQPLSTVSTISNAMDVSRPNNWKRIEELFYRYNRSIQELGYGYVNDIDTKCTIRKMSEFGYLSDPHTAVAYKLLCSQLNSDEFGICLGTAHPAKFKNLIEDILEEKLTILLSDVLEKYMKLPILSYNISTCFSELRHLIVKLLL